jgi:hypothetical protein
MYSNNALKLIGGNIHMSVSPNSHQTSVSIGNINRSNGIKSSSQNKNQNQGNINCSNLFGNNNNILNTKSPKPTGSLLINYSKSNALKERKYSEMSRYSNNASYQQSQENEKDIIRDRDKEKNNKNIININTSRLKNSSNINNNMKDVKLDFPYTNYKKFQMKNGDDDYDIEEFARNVDK